MKLMNAVNGMSSNALLIPLLVIAFGMYAVAMMCHGDAAVRGKIAESATAIVIAGIAVFSSSAQKSVGETTREDGSPKGER